tara:strand:+ start:409 stop:798 length:390 start_codon:yes stop_codon:yes gene_type:complete
LKQFAFISVFIIVGGLFILFFSLTTSYQQPGCGVRDFEPFCGNPISSNEILEGKTIYNTNCAACHKLDKNMTGPALSKKATFYDSISFSLFIKQNRRVHPLDSLYNSNCVKFPNLSIEDSYKLFEYISK